MGRALTWKRCCTPQVFSFNSLIFYAWNRAISIFECLVLWKRPEQCRHLLRMKRYQVTLLEVIGFLQTSWETNCIYPRSWGGNTTDFSLKWDDVHPLLKPTCLLWFCIQMDVSSSMKVGWTQRSCLSSCHSWWPCWAGILATGCQPALKIQATGCLINYSSTAWNNGSWPYGEIKTTNKLFLGSLLRAHLFSELKSPLAGAGFQGSGVAVCICVALAHPPPKVAPHPGTGFAEGGRTPRHTSWPGSMGSCTTAPLLSRTSTGPLATYNQKLYWEMWTQANMSHPTHSCWATLLQVIFRTEPNYSFSAS